MLFIRIQFNRTSSCNNARRIEYFHWFLRKNTVNNNFVFNQMFIDEQDLQTTTEIIVDNWQNKIKGYCYQFVLRNELVSTFGWENLLQK